MLEIEVKSPCPDLEAVERRLRDMGARFKGEIKQSDIYLAHPCRDFAITDEALRLRRENDTFTLYYKGPKLDKVTKTREEIATPVTDPDSLSLILKRLGFRHVGEVEKRRRIYLLNEVEVALDRVTDLGDFVELEFQGGVVEEGRELLLALMRDLGLEKSERSSYLELLLRKRKEVQM